MATLLAVQFHYLKDVIPAPLLPRRLWDICRRMASPKPFVRFNMYSEVRLGGVNPTYTGDFVNCLSRWVRL